MSTHKIKPFNDESGYRGMACSCGFTSSTGHKVADQINCDRHLKDVCSQTETPEAATQRGIDAVKAVCDQWKQSNQALLAAIQRQADELTAAHTALRKAREALETAEQPLQFWLEHARGDGQEETRMPASALMTLKVRTTVKSALTLIDQTLEETR